MQLHEQSGKVDRYNGTRLYCVREHGVVPVPCAVANAEKVVCTSFNRSFKKLQNIVVQLLGHFVLLVYSSLYLSTPSLVLACALPIFRKAILSAFLLLCSHGRKNDIAMLRKFLRKVLDISLRLRKSLRKVLGIRSTNGW